VGVVAGCGAGCAHAGDDKTPAIAEPIRKELRFMFAPKSIAASFECAVPLGAGAS